MFFLSILVNSRHYDRVIVLPMGSKPNQGAVDRFAHTLLVPQCSICKFEVKPWHGSRVSPPEIPHRPSGSNLMPPAQEKPMNQSSTKDMGKKLPKTNPQQSKPKNCLSSSSSSSSSSLPVPFVMSLSRLAAPNGNFTAQPMATAGPGALQVHGLLRQAHLDGEGGGEVPEGGARWGPVGPWAAVPGKVLFAHFGAQVEQLAARGTEVFDKGTTWNNH